MRSQFQRTVNQQIRRQQINNMMGASAENDRKIRLENQRRHNEYKYQVQNGICLECKGKGKGWIFTCRKCNGKGKVDYCQHCSGSGKVWLFFTCDYCHGSGKSLYVIKAAG